MRHPIITGFGEGHPVLRLYADKVLRRWYDKVVKGEPTRKTRLHSMRGEMLRVDQWPAVFDATRARVRGRYLPGPWMTPRAVKRLEALLSPHDRVLELGSGLSTAWFADRVELVRSVEPDPAWARKVRQLLGNRHNVELIEEAIPTSVTGGDWLNSCNVVVVDFDPTFRRPEVVRQACRSAGVELVVHDDSDALDNRIRPEELGADWIVERYIGMKSVPLAVVETSIYRRQGPRSSPG